MRAAKILREKIQSPQPTLGLLVMCHLWHDVVETAQSAGLDYIIIDQEHAGYDLSLVVQVCAIGRQLDFPVLIRPGDTSFRGISHTIDLGPCGILTPQIRSTAQLDVIRDAIWMPPRGQRRPGGAGNRWIKDFNYPTWKSQVEDDFIVIPQIESQEGLDNADAIAGHEVVTAIGVGPYDLSASLGCCWEPTNPKLVGALKRIRDAGRRAGKNMWHLGDPAELLPNGFNFICLGDPMLIMEQALKLKVQAAQSDRTDNPSVTPMPIP